MSKLALELKKSFHLQRWLTISLPLENIPPLILPVPSVCMYVNIVEKIDV